MNRYKIKIQYDGSNFSGFQSQKDNSGIQNKIESSITMLNNKDSVKLCGASRTDSGVHALGQVAHFDLNTNLSESKPRIMVATIPKGKAIIAVGNKPNPIF